MTDKTASSATPESASASAFAEGVRHHRAGHLEAAERCYRRVKRRDANYAEAVRLRGVLAYQRGELDNAIALLRRAAKLRPTDAVYPHTLAGMLRSAGRLEAAIEPYRRAARLDPERAENALDLAATLAQAGRADEALSTYRALLARWPDLAPARAGMAQLLHERSAPRAARNVLQAWQDLCPAEPQARHALAQAWVDIAEYEHAVGIYRAMQAEYPDDARVHGRLGAVLQSRGDFDAATECFERALTIAPDQGWIYAALMSNRRHRMSETHRGAMRRLLDTRSTDAMSRAHLHFAFGHWHDRNDEPQAAFDHFHRGNRIRAELEPFDAVQFDARIERLIDYFAAPDTATAESPERASDKPIFVVGMPRSGTSLVEQILASHPQVHGAGELEDIRRMVRELPAAAGSRKKFPQCLDDLPGDRVHALAARYLGGLDARAPGATRVVDKMPFNLLWLGWIARLFPNARVIHCRREPMDNCLSCYFQMFNKGLRFTYDLAQLGHVYQQQARLMAHWSENLPLSMLTVDYEALVANEDEQIRRLIAFAGLPWDDACLAFHRTTREVRTASVWQVRQPMYRSSVARWHAYSPWLDELRASLGAWAP